MLELSARYGLRAAASSVTEGGLRKLPHQQRAKDTIQKILETAARLLVEVGYHNIVGSPTLLLQESGVSRGSFYAFFSTPEKVLDELAYQWLQSSVERVQRRLLESSIDQWEELVDALIEFYTEEYQNPMVVELWVRQHLTPTMRALDRASVQHTGEALLQAFRKYAPRFDRLSLIQCVVAGEIVERLFQYAFTDSPAGDPLVLDEVRTNLLQYFSAYA